MKTGSADATYWTLVWCGVLTPLLPACPFGTRHFTAFALGASEAYKMALTDNLTKQQKKALNVDALVWLTAAAFHVEPFVKKTQPKELCLQQFIAMPLTALACFLAAKKL